MLQAGSTLDQPYAMKKGKHILHISIYMKYLGAESRLVVLRTGSGVEGKWQGAGLQMEAALLFQVMRKCSQICGYGRQLCECTHCIVLILKLYVMVCEFHFF